MSDDLSTWRHRTITASGGRVNHVATAPGCPNEPHAMRDCGCEVFKSRRDANAYARDQSGMGED